MREVSSQDILCFNLPDLPVIRVIIVTIRFSNCFTVKLFVVIRFGRSQYLSISVCFAEHLKEVCDTGT